MNNEKIKSKGKNTENNNKCITLIFLKRIIFQLNTSFPSLISLHPMDVQMRTKCIKLDHLCCPFADKCTQFCTITSELFNSTISDQMTP